MTDHAASHLDVARRLFAAIEAGDLGAIESLYAPAIRIWHNNDGLEQTREQNLRVLGWLAANVKEIRYEDVRCEATATGFVQQHVMRGTSPSGTPFELPACMVGRIEDGRITRLDEYLDSVHAAGISK